MKPIVWRLEHFAEIDSTNTWLAQQARAGAREGLVVYADFQVSGRGRLDRKWDAPAGSGLLCSILLRPTVDASELQLVVAAVALATRAALTNLGGLRPSLKWPNDVMVGEAKIAGLLGEVVTNSEGIAVVAGCGINLTRSPHDVASTNLFAESGITVTPRALLEALLEELAARCEQLRTAESRAALRVEYEAALDTIGQRVRVERLGDVLVGEAIGVSESGQLVVVVDGAEITVSAGDVVHLRRASIEAS